MKVQYRTCFIHSNMQVTYLCLALVECLSFKNKNKILPEVRKQHFNKAIKGQMCAFCEILWDLAQAHKVRSRLVMTFFEAPGWAAMTHETRVAIKNEMLRGAKREKHLSMTSFLAKVPKEQYLSLIDAVHT